MRIDAELLDRHDRPGPRYTSYPTAVQFDTAFGPEEYADHLALSEGQDGARSIYIHLPFCQARCLYCACHAIINPDGRAAEPYLRRLLREIELVSARLGDGRRVAQLHLGGGTPTFYNSEQLTRLMRRIRRHFDLLPGAELSVELDPRATSPDHLSWLVAQGFNRVSVGVQDIDERVQRAVNRVQPLPLTDALVTLTRSLGINGVNVDLIYGLPHQTTDTFRTTVSEVVEQLCPDRLAVYSFAYVPWLKGHQKKLPTDALPTGREKLELLVVASEELSRRGYRQIGMDHFALPDDDLCRARDEGRLTRNFMGYTTARSREIIGFGLSAIGYVGGAYSQNIKHLKRYQDAIDAGRLPVERGYQLSPDDRLRAWIIHEMMCHGVVDREVVEERFDVEFDHALADVSSRLAPLIADGLLEDDGSTLRATELGRIFVRNIAMAFDRYLPRDTSDGVRGFSRTV